MSTFLNATPEQFKAFIEFPTNSKLHMLNLLKFKTTIDGDASITGEEQYMAYMKAAVPFIQKANAQVLYYGYPRFTIIGPQDVLEWDHLLIVEYQSKEDFLSMVTHPDYPVDLRTKALEDSRLIFCSPAEF